jgi:predicted nucleic acid-binding protein
VPVFFLDSSAVVKRYLQEPGTTWVVETTESLNDNRIFLARITAVEVVSAIIRQKRAGFLSDETADTAITQYRQDIFHQYRMVEVTRLLTERAMTLAEIHALRGYDAIQLAAGVEVHLQCRNLGISSMYFVSADMALNQAAAEEGLDVVNPNLV